jgi:hypothetical protein
MTFAVRFRLCGIACGEFAAMAMALAACQFGKEASPDAGVTVIMPAAPVNESEVTRYPNERKLTGDALLPRAAVARKSPPNGAEVARLPAGTSVKKMADVSDGLLVMFEEPTTKSRMVGWLELGALGDALPVVTAKVLPALPKDAGRDASDSKKDAGAVVIVDAGVAPPVDASAPAAPAADASAPPPSKGADAGAAMSPVRKRVNGKCDAGWINFPKDSEDCRKPCVNDKDCKGLKCGPLVGKGAQKVCS